MIGTMPIDSDKQWLAASMGLGSMTETTHFDADAYWRAGNCPWTFFAFPRILADESGMPPDEDAKRLLAVLQRRGIPVGT